MSPPFSDACAPMVDYNCFSQWPRMATPALTWIKEASAPRHLGWHTREHFRITAMHIALPHRVSPGWLLASCAAAFAAVWAGALAHQAHRLEAALTAAWCGAPGHAEQGLLGHCAPCWLTAAALALTLVFGAIGVRGSPAGVRVRFRAS